MTLTKILQEGLLLEAKSIKKLQDMYVGEDSTDRVLALDLIKLDPTYTESSNDMAGKYGEWLVRTYFKNDGSDFFNDVPDGSSGDPWGIGFHSEYNSQLDPLVEGDEVSITQLLAIFDKYKRYLPENRRNINDYKSLYELVNTLENELQIPQHHILSSLKKKISKITKVMVGKNYTVFQPHTWEEEVALASFSGWCTADTRKDVGGRYFNSYTRNGKLDQFILIPNNQLKDGVPVHANKRSNWLQFTPEYPQFAWGYVDGQTNEEESYESLEELLQSDTSWITKNRDIADYFNKLFPDRGFDGNFLHIIGFEEGSPVQGTRMPISLGIVDILHDSLADDEYNAPDGLDSDAFIGAFGLYDAHKLRSVCSLVPEQSTQEQMKIQQLVEEKNITPIEIDDAVNTTIDQLLGQRIREAFAKACTLQQPPISAFVTLSNSGDGVLSIEADSDLVKDAASDISKRLWGNPWTSVRSCLIYLLGQRMTWPKKSDIDTSDFWKKVIAKLESI